MVFTFLKARGLSVGSSLVEDDKLDLVGPGRCIRKSVLLDTLKYIRASDLSISVAQKLRQRLCRRDRGLSSRVISKDPAPCSLSITHLFRH